MYLLCRAQRDTEQVSVENRSASVERPSGSGPASIGSVEDPLASEATLTSAPSGKTPPPKTGCWGKRVPVKVPM